MDFFVNLTPVIIIIFILLIPIFKKMYGKQLVTTPQLMEHIMGFDEKESLTDFKLLNKCLFVLTIVILGFFAHGALHMEAATIALFGAGLLLFLDNKNPERALHEIEWTTVFFFIGLFVLVGGIEKAGIIGEMAKMLLGVTEGNLLATSVLVLWGSAFMSAFVDNIPFVATMIPLIKDLGDMGMTVGPIWWSLALGACLGGNGTLVGASANLVVAGLAGKSGYHIGFKDYLKTGLFIMVITIVISNIYLYFRYLI